MSTPQTTAQHRRVHEADPDHVEVRQPEVDADDGLFRIRMPVTSTGEARDGDAFSRERVTGFRRQLEQERIPLFLDHGRGGPGETRYGQLRKVGYWDSPSIEERGGATELDADAVLVDPDTLDDGVGEIKAALSWLRAQAEAGLPISASVGWSEDTGGRDLPGNADLLEISVVGIPSDPRTTTTADVARATRDADCSPCEFARELAARGIRPFGPPDGDGDEFEDFEDCVQTLLEDDDDLDREDAEAICGAWQQQKDENSARAEVPPEYTHADMMAAKDQAEEMGVDGGAIHAHGEGEEREFMPGANHESVVAHLRQQGLLEDDGRATYDVAGEEIDITPPEYMMAAAEAAAEAGEAGLIPGDCGTGVGDRRRNQIRNDEVGPDAVAEVASYLTSHEEDVDADGHPRSWTDEEWSDCGNAQYAKWGGVGDGRALAWAQRNANKVARAQDEELPYPNRDMTRNIDDPEFSEGDAVMWSSQDTPVHGRVAGVHEQFSPNENVTITGDDGEAVYSIYEWDDSLEPSRFQNTPSDPNVAKPQSSLSESQLDMPPATAENFEGDENSMSDSTTASEEDAARAEDEMSAAEFRRTMTEMQEEQTRLIREMHEQSMHGDDEDGEEAADEPDEEDAADADETETNSDTETERNADPEPETPKTRDRAEGDDDGTGFGLAHITQ